MTFGSTVVAKVSSWKAENRRMHFIPESHLKEPSREIVSVVQNQRKELGFDITDRIKLEIISDDNKALQGVEMFQDYICKETLTKEFNITQKKGKNTLLDFNLDTNIEKLTNES